MSSIDIARAWRDPTYRESLSEEERALVPSNPAGGIELTEDELSLIVGAAHRHRPHPPSTGTGSREPRCRCHCLVGPR
ncbi:mersacidin/lichenicidin family type 2 lantibiotic [Cystobacter fuscus]|uniref:mersacidin/lichenicidin family type 2 lantibiotic n=1 Tax=Cystobacter fuscus TaxID=43 RepID=UPI002B301746|nr:mersacidin/lichenicidin family type 2 lantibiotic [Cystobacter fuscus]